VQGLVHNKALFLIIREQAKLHKAKDEATLEWLCQCTIQASIGVPCFYDLFNCLRDKGQVLLEDIHPFWWYNQTKISTILENQVPQTIILDPAVVKGKGQPKGSKGKKGSSANSMINSFKTPCITVLILHFLMI
jgi:hypothetical protein